MRLPLLLVLAALVGCAESPDPIVIRPPQAPKTADFNVRKEVRRIGFGGCAGDACSLTLLDTLAARRPDVFIWMGDNVMPAHPDSLTSAYRTLGSDSSFQRLKSTTRMLATWDDADGGDKEAFLNFWKDPMKSVRRQREGVYASYLFDGARRDVLVVLLDTWSFSSTPNEVDGVELTGADGKPYSAEFLPVADPDSTVLGAAQWAWLTDQMSIPCDLRILATPMPFGPSFNGLSTWANFPHEQHRMLQAIAAHEADRTTTLFLSGGAHYGELSRIDSTLFPGLPALYDLTSSSLAAAPGRPTENTQRIGEPVATHNAGLVQFDTRDGVLLDLELLATPADRGALWELP